MKLKAIDVTTLDTYLDIAEVGLLAHQVSQGKTRKYQNNKQTGKGSKRIWRVRNVGSL